MLNYVMGQDENVVWAKCAICSGWGEKIAALAILRRNKKITRWGWQARCM